MADDPKPVKNIPAQLIHFLETQLIREAILDFFPLSNGFLRGRQPAMVVLRPMHFSR